MKFPRKRLIAAVALLLAMVFSLSSCGYFETMMVLLEFVPETYHAKVDFQTLEYVRPDPKVAEDAVANTREVMEKNGSDAELLRAYLEVSRAVDNMRTQYAILDIRHSGNVADEALQEETEWLSEAISAVYSALAVLNRDLLHSRYASLLFGDISDADREMVEKQAILMDEEYVEIQGELTEIVNDYNALSAREITVSSGESYTFSEILDRTVSEKNRTDYFRQYNQLAGELYLEIIPLYRRLAEKCEYETVAEYQYKLAFGRSYHPDQTEVLKSFVKENCATLRADLRNSFTDAELIALQAASQKKDHLGAASGVLNQYFSELNALSMQSAYEYMGKYHLADIDKGEERLQGAYTTYLPSVNVPYMFFTLSEDYSDVFNFVHEFGHFTAFYHTGNVSDLDIAELQSQGGEFLLMAYMPQLYGKDGASAIEKERWLRAMDSLMEGCVMDEFQQRSFDGTHTTVEELNETFVEVATEYGMGESSYLVPLEYLWSAIHHNFQVPFYYISYAVSLVPAMEIGGMAKTNREGAVQAYAAAVLNGNSGQSFEGLLASIGLDSPFSEQAGRRIVAAVEAVIAGASSAIPPSQPQAPVAPGEGTTIFLGERKEDWM